MITRFIDDNNSSLDLGAFSGDDGLGSAISRLANKRLGDLGSSDSNSFGLVTVLTDNNSLGNLVVIALTGNRNISNSFRRLEWFTITTNSNSGSIRITFTLGYTLGTRLARNENILGSSTD